MNYLKTFNQLFENTMGSEDNPINKNYYNFDDIPNYYYAVYKESNLGYLYVDDMVGLHFSIIHASTLKGSTYNDKTGGIIITKPDMKDLRKATKKDFEEFRVVLPPDFEELNGEGSE